MSNEPVIHTAPIPEPGYRVILSVWEARAVLDALIGNPPLPAEAETVRLTLAYAVLSSAHLRTIRHHLWVELAPSITP